MQHLSKIRRDYVKGVLKERDLDPDPFTQFGLWMTQALKSEIVEPTAMALATVDNEGNPSLRMVLLKGFDARGFQFFTHYGSRKARQIDINPGVALLFFWKELERQVRIEGKAIKLSESESDEYFASRPRESQLGAWVSPQSQVVENRDSLEQQLALKRADFHEQTVPRPENWGGYLMKPEYFEFWQGRESRLHDRFAYLPGKNAAWTICRLAP